MRIYTGSLVASIYLNDQGSGDTVYYELVASQVDNDNQFFSNK